MPVLGLDPGDEARIGQKNKITRRWAQKGSRPSAPKDQRTKSAYIFGAICPARGVGAALVLPHGNTQVAWIVGGGRLCSFASDIGPEACPPRVETGFGKKGMRKQ